jgi:hypothetical protein
VRVPFSKTEKIPNDGYLFCIKNKWGKTVSMKAKVGDTVGDLKLRFQEREATPVHQQIWTSSGNDLDDDTYFITSGGTSKDGYNFGADTTVHLDIQLEKPQPGPFDRSGLWGKLAHERES